MFGLRQQISKLFFDYLACAKCSPNEKEDVPAVFYESNIILQSTCVCDSSLCIIIVLQWGMVLFIIKDLLVFFLGGLQVDGCVFVCCEGHCGFACAGNEKK
ncbi:hypothetical protein [Labilibaculum euxinus]